MGLVGGLRFWPKDWRAAVIVTVACMVSVAALVVFTDWAFRPILSPGYVAVFGGPNLPRRILAYMAGAVGEETVFRLLLMSGLVAVGNLLWRGDGASRPALFVAAIAIAQAANVLPKLTEPSSPAEVVYDVLRFYVPGLVWGWLYWRHGFLAALTAHPACHLILQPALLLVLAR
jgi:hypothetical protein